jgi:hypothetical protein
MSRSECPYDMVSYQSMLHARGIMLCVKQRQKEIVRDLGWCLSKATRFQSSSARRLISHVW